MEHSPKYNKVKQYYDNKLWTIEQVYSSVGRWITANEFEEITGQVFIKAA